MHPGYWKNHPTASEEATPTKLLHFELVRMAVDLKVDTFMDALRYQGGSGVAGAQRILLRAAVAAWLNAAHDGLGYPLTRAEFITEVKDALASGDRQRMLALAAELDRLNNLGTGMSGLAQR